jgi:hypothetical protein
LVVNFQLQKVEKNLRVLLHLSSLGIIPFEEPQSSVSHRAVTNQPALTPALQKMEEMDVNNIIDQLLSVRGARPGRQVTLTENEIRWLCNKGREVFISQPVLLELEAPIKVRTCFAFPKACHCIPAAI